MSTVEAVRDAAPEFLSREIEHLAFDMALEEAARKAWREVRPFESVALARHRLIDREFGAVLDMEFSHFLEELEEATAIELTSQMSRVMRLECMALAA